MTASPVRSSPPQGASSPGGEPMSFLDHLRELRKRLLISTAALAVGFLVAFLFSRDLLFLLKLPYLETLAPGKPGLQLLRVQDKFLLDVYMALFGGVALSAPVWLWQIWLFVAPGLYEHERRHASGFLLASGFLFGLGVLFGWAVILPFTFRFFEGYNVDAGSLRLFSDWLSGLAAEGRRVEDVTQASLLEYVEFTGWFLIAFGLAFQTPLFMALATRLGLVEPELFTQGRRWAVVIIFVLAAILTPPDPISQFGLALPLLGLYEVGVWVSRWLAPTDEGVASPPSSASSPPQ